MRTILRSVAPGAAIGVLYLLFLGYRRDYLGHYAAGFGGTLTAVALLVSYLTVEKYSRSAPFVVVATVVGCIVAGAFAEATIFNLAKFDEVDFCNQSLGAVLAGMGFLAMLSDAKPSDWVFRAVCFAGLIALHIGFYFAIL